MDEEIINNLKNTRPIYHSEADLQFALGWQIQNNLPNSDVRFEKPFENKYVDIIYNDNQSKIGIELKYKTSELECNFKNEKFLLKEHSAIDLGRFDVIADIERLEYFISKGYISKGYVFFVTNCSSYWQLKANNSLIKSQDFEFRLHDKHILSGKLNWQKGAKEKTYGKKRIKGLKLGNKYEVNWKPFSFCGNNQNNEFKYILFEVLPSKEELKELIENK